jgi:hypothetical protein
MRHAGVVDDAVLADLADVVGHQRNVRLIERAQVVVGDQDAFAAEAVVRQ